MTSPRGCASAPSTPPDLAIALNRLDANRGYRFSQPQVSASDGFAALCGRLDNQHELRLAEMRDCGRLELTGDAALIWALYRSSGTAVLRQLKGVFSVIVADFSRSCIHLYRSPLLGPPLFYFLSAEWLVAASEASAVVQHPAVGRDLSDSWLAHFFNFETPPNAATPFMSVTELLPGEQLSITRGNHDVERHPPDIGRRPTRFRHEREYVERFDELVSQSVARQVKGRKNIGIMLSGGLDSVPAAYWMQRHRDIDSRLAGYSWSLDGFPEADEYPLIKLSADMIGIPARVVEGDGLWPPRSLEAWPLPADSPQQNPFRLLKNSLYGMAAMDGCRFLFNGNYGDNLYPPYHYVLTDALYGGKPARLTSELRFLAGLAGLPGFFRHGAVRQVAKRALGWQGRPRTPDDALTAFAHRLVESAGVWPPEASEHPRPDQYRALLGTDIARGISGEDQYTAPYDLELVEPYVDWDLVDFVLAVPSYVFWNRAETKVLMRRAMQGRIPEQIRCRPRGGLLTSFFEHGMAKRIDWIRHRLFSGETDWPRFVESAKIETILDSGRPGERQSMLLWQCISYETWLDRYFR